MKSQKAEHGRMKVFVRIKPPESVCKEAMCVEVQKDQLQVLLNGQKEQKWYKFDGVFPNNTKNHEVYEHVGKPVVLGALNGFNGTVFAYGQTGSGKTHSLMSNDGITANMINKLFSKITRDRDHTCKIKFGYLQIYQEKMFDLLNEDSSLRLNVREDPSAGIYIENLAEYACHSPLDVLELLRAGQKKLIFAETKMNRRSSRSHAVCQISVIRSKRKAGEIEETTRRAQNGLSPIKDSTKRAKRANSSSSSKKRNSQNINRTVKFRARSEGHLKTASSEDQIAAPQVDGSNDRPVSAVEAFHEKGQSLDTSVFDDSFTSLPDNEDNDDYITSLEKDVLLKGKINICDLAGSERIKLTGVEGERLHEAQHINLSLLELGNVISALAEGNRTYVPYRNSLLTRLLQDSLGGNCKTTFLLCVSQGLHYVNETKSTLDFGHRALKVRTMPRVNVEVDYKMLAEDLKLKLLEQERLYSLLKTDYELLTSKENGKWRVNEEGLLEKQTVVTEPPSLEESDGTNFGCKSADHCREKARSVLMAQLMSLQLVYSVRDIAEMGLAMGPSPDQNKNSPGFVGLKSSEQSLLSEAEKTSRAVSSIVRTPSSSPSGYETASPRSSQDDIRCNQDDALATNANEAWQQTVKEPVSFSNTCSPLLDKLRAPYSPRRSCILENLIETQLFGVNLENVLQMSAFAKTVNDLQRELKQLKVSIDRDLGQFCADVFQLTEPLKTSENEVDCKNICALLMQRLSDPKLADALSPDALDQLSNLVMVEQTLTGCLFALKDNRVTSRQSMLLQSQVIGQPQSDAANSSPIENAEPIEAVSSKDVTKKTKRKSRLQRFMCLPMRKKTTNSRKGL